ncbi:MAG: hypothetical protein H7Y36_08675 [Armatimonadetes bacterium]|nr:hypothetical protein [Akkermansiaceae bacterium]
MLKRQMIRLMLAVLLVVFTFLAALIWSKNYDKQPDPKARFTIRSVQVKRDQSFYWLDIHLKKSGPQAHDMRRQVRLIDAVGQKHEPADTTFAGSPETGFTDIWYKFWLEKQDLESSLTLRINDGLLRVKTNQGMPEIGKHKAAVFNSSDWRKSWLGF